jgi:hypothetical protein
VNETDLQYCALRPSRCELCIILKHANARRGNTTVGRHTNPPSNTPPIAKAHRQGHVVNKAQLMTFRTAFAIPMVLVRNCRFASFAIRLTVKPSLSVRSQHVLVLRGAQKARTSHNRNSRKFVQTFTEVYASRKSTSAENPNKSVASKTKRSDGHRWAPRWRGA